MLEWDLDIIEFYRLINLDKFNYLNFTFIYCEGEVINHYAIIHKQHATIIQLHDACFLQCKITEIYDFIML